MPAHAIVDDLRRALGPGCVITDPDILVSFSRDSASLGESHLPLVAVTPATEADVQAVIALAHQHRVPMVPQGAMTGLSGGSNAVPNCIAISSRRLNRILNIDPDNRIAVVQPGVVNRQLSDAAAEFGLSYRPDPSSWESSTIGGNIATNAGGLCCVKYGVTSRFVRGLRVVLPDGRVAGLGRRTVKGVAGLNLTELFVGSEGTLGFITEATLGLESASAPPLTLAATFTDASSAARACARIRAAGITPSLFELIDRTVVAAINKYARMGFDDRAGALLIAQSDAGTGAAKELAVMAELCTQGGATDLVVAEDAQESELIVQSRRLAYPALEALGPVLVDDVAVPLFELGRMIDECERVAERYHLVIGVVGHAGDGNVHPNVIADPSNPEALAAAYHAFDEIAEYALVLGGTITGEHGVGLLKRGLLEKELDPVAAQLQRSIKELIDPHYLMNPGKVLTAR